MIIVSVIIIIFVTTIISFFGARIIGKAHVVAVIAPCIVSVWIAIRIFSLVPFSQIWEFALSDNPANIGYAMSIGGAFDVIMATGFGWIMCVADYTRYSTGRKSATIAPFFGSTVGFILFSLIVATSSIAVAVMNNGLFNPNSAELSYICQNLGMGQAANVLIVVSTVAVNMINIYSGSFSAANISEKFTPKKIMIVMGALSAILALTPLLLGSFLDTFQVFLGYLGAVFPPCIAILVIDYFVIHKQKYDITQFNKKGGKYWYHGGWHIPGIVSFVLGVASYFLAAYIPVVPDTIGQVLFCFIFTAIMYLIIKKAAQSFTAAFFA